MKNTQGTTIPVRPIDESVRLNKQLLQNKINNEISSSKSTLFTNLTEKQKSILKSECQEKLKKLMNKPSLFSFFCFSKESKKIVNKGILDLLTVIKNRCLEEPAVFRKEGSKDEAKEIIDLLIRNKKINFSKYSVLTLATTFKTYVRDHLDGLFNPRFVELALKYLKQYKYKELRQISDLYIFSLFNETRTVFIELQEIIKKISKESTKTRMTEESLTNILCLTLTPQSLFTNIEVVDYLRIFLNFFINIDMNDIETVAEYLKK